MERNHPRQRGQHMCKDQEMSENGAASRDYMKFNRDGNSVEERKGVEMVGRGTEGKVSEM